MDTTKLKDFALTIVFLAMVIAIGLVVLDKFKLADRTIGSSFDSNETFTALNATAVSFANSYALTCTGTKIANLTGTDVTTKFTVSGCTALLKDVTQNNTRMTANYTYSEYRYGAAYNATSEIEDAIAEIPGWVSILIVVVIGGIVLFVMQRAYQNRE